MLGNLGKPSGTYSLALSSKLPIPIGLKVSDETFANSCVIDSGVTNYMTHLSYQFNNYNSCPSSRKIVTIDGSLTIVIGIGDIQISPILTLQNVFHVSKLPTNLVSMQKLTEDLGCNIIFYSTHCVYYD